MNNKKTRPTLSEQGEEPNLAVTLGEQGGQPYVNKEANPGCAVHPWLRTHFFIIFFRVETGEVFTLINYLAYFCFGLLVKSMK